MAGPHDIRRLAFQALFQFDAQGGSEADLRAWLVESGKAEGLNQEQTEAAATTALGAFAERAKADAAMAQLAPQWPAHRQAAVDRAILRLAHFEMRSGGVPPKVAVNEAVLLAKEFSTEKSPAFVNGLLDKILKTVEAEQAAAKRPASAAAGPAGDAAPSGSAGTPT